MNRADNDVENLRKHYLRLPPLCSIKTLRQHNDVSENVTSCKKTTGMSHVRVLLSYRRRVKGERSSCMLWSRRYSFLDAIKSEAGLARVDMAGGETTAVEPTETKPGISD